MKSAQIFILKTIVAVIFCSNAFANNKQELENARQNHEICVRNTVVNMFKNLSCDVNINVSETRTGVLNYCGSKLDGTLNEPQSQEDLNNIRNLNESVHDTGTKLFNSAVDSFQRNCQVLNALQDEVSNSNSGIQILNLSEEGAL